MRIAAAGCILIVNAALCAPSSDYLVTGRMRPAFDHLGGLGGFADQADAAVASGCTIVYTTGLGQYSYNGLPPKATMDAYLVKLREYNRRAHAGGAGILLSYLCATSIVDLDKFAQNWNDYFPNRPADFIPEKMLQQDINGNNLPSWYGGAYAPADMWNPYWRQYTKLTIKLAAESGHDGVYFDNPTVHNNGNFSAYAMKAWAGFLKKEGIAAAMDDLPNLRALTKSHPELWLRFRVTEAADFIREMHDYCHSLKPGFVLTVNNSLNSWDTFYSQPRYFAYSIPQQSPYEDLLTIEDMGSQPRRQGDSYVSYGSTLDLIHAVGNGRPLSICTTDGGRIGPPNLMALSIAECTAHDASYMVWSCWEPGFRDVFAASLARYHKFLETNAALFEESRPAADVLLIWPYENWLRHSECVTAYLARELGAANIQFDVVTEADLTRQRLQAWRVVAYAAEEGLVRPATTEMLRVFEQQGGAVVRVGPRKAGVPAGVSADSSADGYSAAVVFDGKHFSIDQAQQERVAIAAHRNLGDADNTFRSGAGPSQHWVERQWPKPQHIGRVVIWWGGLDTWPKKYAVEYWQDGWRRVPGNSGWMAAKDQQEQIQLSAPVTTDRLRVVQDAGGGGPEQPNSLSIQELSAYMPDKGPNVCRVNSPGITVDVDYLRQVIGNASVTVEGERSVRAVVRRTKSGKCILHLYNLNVQRSDSYHDDVTPVENLHVSWLLPRDMSGTTRVRLLTPDESGTSGWQNSVATPASGRTRLDFVVPKLYIWTVVTLP